MVKVTKELKDNIQILTISWNIYSLIDHCEDRCCDTLSNL